MIRLGVMVPRSLILTMTDLPVLTAVTLTRVPKGRVRWQAVRRVSLKVSPLAVFLPFHMEPYQEAMPVPARRRGCNALVRTGATLAWMRAATGSFLATELPATGTRAGGFTMGATVAMGAVAGTGVGSENRVVTAMHAAMRSILRY